MTWVRLLTPGGPAAQTWSLRVLGPTEDGGSRLWQGTGLAPVPPSFPCTTPGNAHQEPSSELICKLGQNSLFHKALPTIQLSPLTVRLVLPTGNVVGTSSAEISYLQHLYTSQNLQDLLYFHDRQESTPSY